jgi:hypothetical protein
MVAAAAVQKINKPHISERSSLKYFQTIPISPG